MVKPRPPVGNYRAGVKTGKDVAYQDVLIFIMTPHSPDRVIGRKVYPGLNEIVDYLKGRLGEGEEHGKDQGS